MPNIELHGFVEKTKQVKDAVWAGFLSTEHLREFSEDVVVTEFSSMTDNVHGRQSPFIRVFFGTKDEKEKCKNVLSRVPNMYAGIFLMLSLYKWRIFVLFRQKNKNGIEVNRRIFSGGFYFANKNLFALFCENRKKREQNHH